jgi:hypothetical protein
MVYLLDDEHNHEQGSFEPLNPEEPSRMNIHRCLEQNQDGSIQVLKMHFVRKMWTVVVTVSGFAKMRRAQGQFRAQSDGEYSPLYTTKYVKNEGLACSKATLYEQIGHFCADDLTNGHAFHEGARRARPMVRRSWT